MKQKITMVDFSCLLFFMFMNLIFFNNFVVIINVYVVLLYNTYNYFEFLFSIYSFKSKILIKKIYT